MLENFKHLILTEIADYLVASSSKEEFVFYDHYHLLGSQFSPVTTTSAVGPAQTADSWLPSLQKKTIATWMN